MIRLLKAKSNSFFGNSFLIFFTRFFPALANLVVIIYFSHKLPKETYGVYQTFWIHYYIFYSIVCMGIHLWLVTYSREVVVSIFKRLNARQLVIYAVVVMAICLCFAFLQYHSPGKMFLVPLLFLALTPVAAILESFLIICRSYKVLVPVNIIYAIAYILLHWYVLQNRFSISVLFGFILVIFSIKAIFYIIVSVVEYRKTVHSTDYENLDIPANSKSLLIHVGIFDLLQMLSNSIDKFIISLVLTAEQTAIYFNGSQNVPFLPLLLSAAGNSVLMQLAYVKKENESDKTATLMAQSGRMLSCIVFPMFFYVLIFRYELMTVVFTDKYLPSVPIFFFSTLILPLRAYSFTTVLQKMHKGVIINIGSLIELFLACALMYPLYRLMGLCGVAFSFVITTYLQAAFYTYHSSKLLNVSPLKLLPLRNWSVKLLLFAIIFLSVHYFITPIFNQRITLVLGGVIMTASVLLSLLVELKAIKSTVTS